MENVTKNPWKDVPPGERLRICRKRMNLTHLQLMDKVRELPENGDKERNEKQIGYIESGKRKLSAEYARLFGKVLGVQPSFLLGETDFETETARFHSVIGTMKHEGNLLYTGLCAFAMLTDYEVTPPNLSNTGSFENYFKQMKAGYRITKGNQTVTLSLEEMNRFENEVCDFVELKLKHLFKQKGVDSNG